MIYEQIPIGSIKAGNPQAALLCHYELGISYYER